MKKVPNKSFCQTWRKQYRRILKVSGMPFDTSFQERSFQRLPAEQGLCLNDVLSITVLRNHKELISDVLMEVLMLLEHSKQNPFHKLQQPNLSSSPSKSFGSSAMR